MATAAAARTLIMSADPNKQKRGILQLSEIMRKKWGLNMGMYMQENAPSPNFHLPGCVDVPFLNRLLLLAVPEDKDLHLFTSASEETAYWDWARWIFLCLCMFDNLPGHVASVDPALLARLANHVVKVGAPQAAAVAHMQRSQEEYVLEDRECGYDATPTLGWLINALSVLDTWLGAVGEHKTATDVDWQALLPAVAQVQHMQPMVMACRLATKLLYIMGPDKIVRLKVHSKALQLGLHTAKDPRHRSALLALLILTSATLAEFCHEQHHDDSPGSLTPLESSLVLELSGHDLSKLLSSDVRKEVHRQLPYIYLAWHPQCARLIPGLAGKVVSALKQADGRPQWVSALVDLHMGLPFVAKAKRLIHPPSAIAAVDAPGATDSVGRGQAGSGSGQGGASPAAEGPGAHWSVQQLKSFLQQRGVSTAGLAEKAELVAAAAAAADTVHPSTASSSGGASSGSPAAHMAAAKELNAGSACVGALVGAMMERGLAQALSVSINKQYTSRTTHFTSIFQALMVLRHVPAFRRGVIAEACAAGRQQGQQGGASQHTLLDTLLNMNVSSREPRLMAVQGLVQWWAQECQAEVVQEMDRHPDPPSSDHGAAGAAGMGAAAGECCAQCGAAAAPDGSKLKKCSSCGRVRYCGRACQSAHWKAGHKAECEG